MLAIVLIVGMGEELWIRFVPEYLLALGGTVWAVAAYRTLFNLLDAVYQYPGGWVADHLGRRRALILFTLMAAAGYGVYLIAPGWQWVLVGTLLGLTIVLCFVAAGVVWWFFDGGQTAVQPAAPVASVGFLMLWRGMDARLKQLLVADILARWAEGMGAGFVLLYVINELNLSYVDFGLLITVQRLTNIVVYVPLAAMSDRMNRKPFVLLTFAFFALFPLVLVNVTGFWGAVAAFVVAGLWELGEPARKALIVDLAHTEARGRAVGIYYLARNLAAFPAALVGGMLWEQFGPGAVFYAAFAVGTVGCVVYALWRERDGDASAAPVTVN
jgi:MFS family permease